MSEYSLILTSELRAEMIQHASDCFPEEACGIAGGEKGIIVKFLPVINELHSSTRFRMDPSEQLKTLLQLEEEKLDLLAIFHSHPSGPGIPSQTDLDEFAYPGTIYLIAFPEREKWTIKAFHVNPDQYKEIPIQS